MIVELLKAGKANAVSTADLCSMVGVGSARELQTIIARERKAGAVILSSCAGGYYLPASREEVEEFVRTQDKKARSIMFVLKSARQYMNQLDGQMTMTEGGLQ